MVSLKRQPLIPFSRRSQQVYGLYHSAFPAEERPPYLLSRLFALQPAIAFSAYSDGDTFAGFAYTVTTSQATFVFLLAIDDAVRSRGYGSAILRAIAEQSADLPLVLCIELLDETAPNYPQRLKRLAFYEKNGFKRQYKNFHELSEVYEILATADNLDYRQLQGDLNRVSLGLLNIKIDE